MSDARPNPAEQVHPPEAAHAAPGVAPGRVRAVIGALSHRGKVRESNEDAYVVFRGGRFLERVVSNIPEAELPSHSEDTGYLMVVADGMGGHEAGEVASRTALVTTIQLILRSPRWTQRLDDPATREAEIQEMLARVRGYLAGAHEALRQQAAGDVRLAGMGTTLTAAFSVGVDFFVLHVGDSKAFLFRDGALIKITRDHTVAQEYADLGVIAQEQVATHRMHHVLTRAVGGPGEAIEGDLHHLTLADGDRILLCSDGLTDMAREPEIARVLEGQGSSEEACQALVDLALERGGRDNVTVVVARYAVG